MASMVNPTLPYQAGLNHFLLFVGNDRSYQENSTTAEAVGEKLEWIEGLELFTE